MDKSIKNLAIVVAVILLLSIAPMPFGYYTFMRIVITIIAIFFAIYKYDNTINFWVIFYGLVAILFNPIFPIVLSREIWHGIDFIVAVIFILDAYWSNIQEWRRNKNNEKH